LRRRERRGARGSDGGEEQAQANRERDPLAGSPEPIPAAVERIPGARTNPNMIMQPSRKK
jgi:ribosome assembly protein YihI (activator of Der GTPase)